MGKFDDKTRKNTRLEAHRAIILLGVMILIGVIFSNLASAGWWYSQPTAYYRFDNSFTDDSNNYDLEASAAIDFYTPAKLNQAAYFNWTGAYLFNQSIPQFRLESFTMALWVNITSHDTSEVIFTNLETGGVGTNGQILLGTASALCGGANLCLYAITTAGTEYKAVINISINDSKWHRIVATRNASTSVNSLKVYVDNGLTNATKNILTTDNFTLSEADYMFTIGSFAGNPNVWNYTGLVDDFQFYLGKVWSDAEVNTDWNSGNGLVAGTPGDITINLNAPAHNSLITYTNITFNSSYSTNSIVNLTNITYHIWNSTHGIFNSTAIVVRGIFNSTVLTVGNFSMGDYKWNVLACGSNATTHVCLFADSNYTFIIGAGLINLTYSYNTYETTSERFYAEFGVLPSSQVSSVQFVYNGTNYTVSNLNRVGNTLIVSKSIDIPLNSNPSANESKGFWFRFIFAGSFTQETDVYQQNVSYINLQTCNGTYQTTTLNFTAKNETIPLNRLTAFFLGGNFNYWIGNGTVKKTYALQNSSVNNEIRFCLYPNITLKTDADIDYSAIDFSQRSYYLRNAAINNVSNSITLYLLDSPLSTSVIMNIKDKYLTNLKNHFVKILRYYPGLGAYYLVEIAKTDDFGNALVKVQEEDVDYRVQIENSTGSQIYSSNPMRIICTSAPCQLEFITGVTEHVVQQLIDFYNVDYNLKWDNNTGYVLFEFSDSTGLTQSMRLKVVKITGYGEVVICDNTIEGAAGLSSCYIGNQTGEYTARVYRTASPLKYFAYLNISIKELWKLFGTEGLVWMLLFVVVMFFAGLSIGPAAAGVMTLVSIIFMMATGIVYMPLVVFISIAVVIIIFIIKMRS